MTRIQQILILALSVLLLGCVDDNTYPISGEQCSEGDPVQDIRPPDCAALPTGIGTM